MSSPNKFPWDRVPWERTGRFAARALVVFVAYSGLNWIAGDLQVFPGVSMIYPASAVGVVAAFLWRWPAAVGVFLATLATPWGSGSHEWILVYALGNTVEAVLPAWILDSPHRTGRPTAARVFLWACVVNTLLNVFLGRTLRSLAGQKPFGDDAVQGFLAWWIGDAVAIAVFALPVLLRLRPGLFFERQEILRWSGVRHLPTMAFLVTSVIAVSVLVYFHDLHFSHSFNWPVLLYLAPLCLGLAADGLPTATVAHAFASGAYLLTLALEVERGVPSPLRSAEVLVVIFGNLVVFTVFVWVAGTIRSHNLWLVGELEERWRTLRHSFDATVKALAAAMEAKDRETERHLDRVSRHAVEIGRRLGLDTRELDLLRWGAILHDIGKIGVPQSILLKPGPLTPAEHEEMERHLELGAQILEKTGLLEEVIPYVRYHEERWDGAREGRFPAHFGLRGQEIPLGARIIAVADAFDAMVSDRPYRDALGVDVAVDELRKEAGRQFDPRIVTVFLEVLVEQGVMDGASEESEEPEAGLGLEPAPG